MFKFDHIVATSGEVDATLQTANGKSCNTHQNGSNNNEEGSFGHLHEVDVGIGEEITRKSCGEGQTEPLILVGEVFVDDARQPNCGEEGGNDADAERHGKPTNGTRTEVVEDNGGDDRGEVGVENGREGISVTIRKSLLEVLAGTKFFLSTLINEHVGIDGHTERKHHTGQSAHGEGGLEGCEHTESEEEVEDEGAIGHHTRNEAIESTHEGHE